MNILVQFLEIVGSLGLFLYGMKIMSEGIQKSAGDRMKTILKFMTGNRFAAVFTGVVITGIIQSSSATTVMVVSFVNAGLMNLTQSIGVILGANIGTTITGWIVALFGFKIKITAMAIPAIGIGCPLMFIKSIKHRDFGEALVGFGLLFLGLDFLKDSVPDISQYPEALAFLSRFAEGGTLSMILFVVVGVVITGIVQSSSAAMAITLTMAYSGWISYPEAAALVLGQNIGTTITAYLASLGTSVTARRASRAHILFNVLGTLWVMVLFNPFLRLVDVIVPGDVYGPNATTLLPTHLAMYHTIFNVLNTILFIPFIKQFAALVTKMVAGSEIDEGDYHFKYISSTLQDTPELYLIKVKDEIYKMASVISEMFSRFRVVFASPDTKLGDEVNKLKKMEDYTDQMQEQLSQFLVDMTQDSLNPTSAQTINGLIRVINELESVGDSCYNLILLSERRYDKKIHFDEMSHKAIEEYASLVQEFLDFIRDHLDRRLSTTDLAKANEYEEAIDAQRNTLKEDSERRLAEGADVKTEFLLL